MEDTDAGEDELLIKIHELVAQYDGLTARLVGRSARDVVKRMLGPLSGRTADCSPRPALDRPRRSFPQAARSSAHRRSDRHGPRELSAGGHALDREADRAKRVGELRDAIPVDMRSGVDERAHVPLAA